MALHTGLKKARHSLPGRARADGLVAGGVLAAAVSAAALLATSGSGCADPEWLERGLAAAANQRVG